MNFETLSPESYSEHLATLGTNEKNLERDVQSLIEWLEKQPHLPNYKDEAFLRSILLFSKNRMAKAKNHLEKLFTVRYLIPGLVINCDIRNADFKSHYDIAVSIPLPKLTPDGNRVIVFRVNHQRNVPLPPVDDFIKMGIINQMIIMHKLGVTFKSTIIICDFKNITMAFISHLMVALKKILFLSGSVLPIRREKIYVLHMLPVMDPLFALTAKMIRKQGDETRLISWKKDTKDLVEVIPKEVLPSDYGGSEKSFDELIELWYETMKEYNEWIQEQNKYVADLSKKPPEMETDLDLASFGSEGSFRELDID